MTPNKNCDNVNDNDNDYFGKDNTIEGYINFFNRYANSDNITPKSYAEFTLRKIGRNNSPSNIELTSIQKDDLNYLIQNNGSFEDLCNILNTRQLEYIGW